MEPAAIHLAELDPNLPDHRDTINFPTPGLHLTRSSRQKLRRRGGETGNEGAGEGRELTQEAGFDHESGCHRGYLWLAENLLAVVTAFRYRQLGHVSLV